MVLRPAEILLSSDWLRWLMAPPVQSRSSTLQKATIIRGPDPKGQ